MGLGFRPSYMILFWPAKILAVHHASTTEISWQILQPGLQVEKGMGWTQACVRAGR